MLLCAYNATSYTAMRCRYLCGISMSDHDIPLILGVDGGATKTIAFLGDARSGAIIGRGRSRGSNFHAHAAHTALAELDTAIGLAFSDAQLARRPVLAACMGVAGVSRGEDEQMVRQWVAEQHIAEHLLIANDGWLVISAGTPDGVGVGLICGTGSIAVGRDAHARTVRAGGWGYLIGDEGSGYDVAVMALRAASHAADGRGPQTQILPALLRHWNLTVPEDLITFLYGSSDPRMHMADIGPLVVDLANAGDAVAQDIVARAAHELATMVRTVGNALNLSGPVPVAVAGSMIVQSEILQQMLIQTLATQGMNVRLTVVPDPTVGALRLAQRLSRGEPNLQSEW
jgi:N-acetylglucosamine kinase-like BadF-type ATPase